MMVVCKWINELYEKARHEMSNENIRRHINLLGLNARDKVTNIRGTVTSVSFDLYGCVQAVISQRAADDGTVPDGRWFDINRLEMTGEERVMGLPDFDKAYVEHGAADKPLP